MRSRHPPEPNPQDPTADQAPRELVLEFEAAMRQRRLDTQDGSDLVAEASRRAAEIEAAGQAEGARVGERRAAEISARAREHARRVREDAERTAAAIGERAAHQLDRDVAWVLSQVLPGAPASEPTTAGVD